MDEDEFEKGFNEGYNAALLIIKTIVEEAPANQAVALIKSALAEEGI